MYTCAPMYPGPVSIHPEALKAMSRDYYPARYNPQYAKAYEYVCTSIQEMCNTKNDVVLATGEGMLGLWAALKSTLKAGDKVLTIGTGIFGDGFADMAKALKCEVYKLSYPYDSTINQDNIDEIEKIIDTFKPTMITLVHCETPSGTLNPLEAVGALKKKKNVPLFVVDAVASMGGVPIYADDCNIDILLGGSQKCFSCPADMSILAISPKAWEYIEQVAYIGYEALKPFMGIGCDPTKYPYTPHSSGVFALEASMQALAFEGYEKVYKRHEDISLMCREGIKEAGLTLFPRENAISSPTVTAVYLPQNIVWKEKQEELRDRGVFLGGSLGSLENKIFRVGHMGTQANPVLMKRTLDVIKDSFK